MSAIETTINWAVELAVELAKDFEDGKMNFAEAIALWDNAFGLVGVAKRIKDIPKEWDKVKDDNAFWDAVVNEVEAKLDLKSNTVKDLVLQVLKTGIEVKNTILISKKLHDELKAR